MKTAESAAATAGGELGGGAPTFHTQRPQKNIGADKPVSVLHIMKRLTGEAERLKYIFVLFALRLRGQGWSNKKLNILLHVVILEHVVLEMLSKQKHVFLLNFNWIFF